MKGRYRAHSLGLMTASGGLGLLFFGLPIIIYVSPEPSTQLLPQASFPDFP